MKHLTPNELGGWFGPDGDLEHTLAATAKFLLAEKNIDAIAPSYALALNRSYRMTLHNVILFPWHGLVHIAAPTAN